MAQRHAGSGFTLRLVMDGRGVDRVARLDISGALILAELYRRYALLFYNKMLGFNATQIERIYSVHGNPNAKQRR